ncbi:3-phosphoshikimate 1-carboxyvinyltransferase [Tepiditoga spiralis]|uniref:3-phosphoshikimate 1-carboxyvinyltransferase n=1 Tax=Tepiditoga spiralis TaxID=2108365 RepID=A0A7G1G3W2_9BACT|nr:3-phosphoshikimate 1-carboxyvinyltransferase [Tepiditoga spiralis]BBE31011.1 3-phosphoshikimate 1-carboxyvinyltransferase [Tepiditoga spiralis]
MIKILRSKINGSITVPSSKSIMQRAIAISLLSNRKIILKNISFCEDSNNSINVIKKFGKKIIIDENNIVIDGKIEGIPNEINCGESGLCVRMFTPIISLFSKKIKVNGKGSILKRPVGFFESTLKELGVGFKCNNNFLPLEVKGPIKFNKCLVDGSISSQFLTGLLIALPNKKNDTIVEVKNLKSKGYIDMTLKIMKDFGVNILNENYKKFFINGNQKYKRDFYTIEGDWSSAAYFLVAGAISESIEVHGLNINSKQPDKNIINILKEVGANVEVGNEVVKVKKNELRAFTYDSSDSPDLFPVLVVLAAFCEGKSIIYGVNRLLYKESNRAKVIFEEFSKIGIKINIDGNKMEVFKSEIKNGFINTHNDHRIAMAAAIAGINSNTNIILDNKECVNKSYKMFWDDYKKVGGKIE